MGMSHEEFTSSCDMPFLLLQRGIFCGRIKEGLLSFKRAAGQTFPARRRERTVRCGRATTYMKIAETAESLYDEKEGSDRRTASWKRNR